MYKTLTLLILTTTVIASVAFSRSDNEIAGGFDAGYKQCYAQGMLETPAPVTPIVEVPIPNIEATIQARVTQGLLIEK